MTKYNLSLTYAPKIQAVIDGRCRQTIRATDKFVYDDLVSFHGWEGKPYKSKWSFRTPYFKLKTVINVDFNKKYGAYINGTWYGWDDPEIIGIAKLDYIDPPTGEELKNVLFGLNKSKESHFEAQIIRWSILGADDIT